MRIARLARHILPLLALAWSGAPAQPLASPAPLTAPAADASAGPWVLAELRARQALQAGFPGSAAIAYRELLAAPGLPAEVRPRLVLALVTALLDSAQLAAAEAALQAYDGPRDTAYHLRAGLLAANARRWPQVRAALEAGRIEDLPAVDRGWWHFLQAMLADSDGDLSRATTLYEQAAGAAGSEQARSRFLLSQEQARLRAGQASEAQLATFRRSMETHQGTGLGYSYARSYAAALFELGRAQEAQQVLQRQLDTVPPSERDAADRLRLIFGLIAGESSEAGRRALATLVERGQQAETQRIALQLLTRGARTVAARDRLRADLANWINAPAAHPIEEDLVLALALLELEDSNLPGHLADAERHARRLLEEFPASPLRPAALGVRLSVAWEEQRYRAVADVVAQLRALLPAGPERAELGVLLAEAFFRARDYPSAAAAYEAALREAAAVAEPGKLIFQRSLAEILSGRPDQAARVLDEAASNPEFDAISRWQAEWNLVKELQVRGQAADALARVERLLQEGAAGVAPELRIRLLWLQADLSFDLDRHEAALRLADALLAELPGAAGVDQPTRAKVAGNTLLLKAQALLALGREAEGTAALEQLRVQYRGTAASAYSFVVQAARLTSQGKLAEAQKVLTELADSLEEFLRGRPEILDPEREELRGFASLALYEAAMNAERQGLDRNLREAHNLLERIKRDHPRDDLRFYAMLKQGDLLRNLNDFPASRQVYEEILISYAQHPDVLLAQLALADTLFALGANSVVNYESAAALFERLRDLPSAPVDLRAEAGFK
ncbi:MAG TPA: hypothetical protein VEB66_09200, partial [Opitutaceae bacterium]|nr:hypothetical protein [Opitutaceae bacterium]